MIDLKRFFMDNIGEDEYYSRFKKLIEHAGMVYNVFDGYVKKDEEEEYCLQDTEEVIEKFKILCQPGVTFDTENHRWFVLTAFYLFKNGYVIEQFPNVLQRPPSKPSEFTYDEIKNKAFALGLNDGNTIRYATRRKLVSEMNFQRVSSSIDPSEQIDELIRKISTRDVSFEDMGLDEKLRELANLIENLLKVKSNFLTLDYKIVAFDYIDDDIIKKYRKQIQCFRHSSDDSIQERETFTDVQKLFLVDYGIIIGKTIYSIKKNENVPSRE